jgi:hypothetical protein
MAYVRPGFARWRTSSSISGSVMQHAGEIRFSPMKTGIEHLDFNKRG